jgi:alpha-beta hydrolase superfamily lysophospholipase
MLFRLLRVALGILALALLLQPETGRAQAPAAKRYTIDTIDGVKLKANLWVGKNGKDGATVILLHNFDNKGGDCQKDGWNDLAAALQKEGHSVLSFDFRGHGESIGVDPAKFWSNEFAYNQRYVKFKLVEGKPPESITQTNFRDGYYPFLVNDITAVRAFLDKQNDAGTINTKNVVVIGAGQGATLGMLWMESEMRRRQGVPINPALGLAQALLLPPAAINLKDPAGRDLVGGIFLSPSPTLGGMQVPVHSWLKNLGKENKVPLAFITAEGDKEGTKYALNLLLGVSPDYVVGKAPPKELPFTGEKAIETKLTGSQMLSEGLPTEKWIVQDYLPKVLEKRTIIAQATQGFDKYPSFWIWPTTRVPARLRETDDTPRPLPLSYFGITRP